MMSLIFAAVAFVGMTSAESIAVYGVANCTGNPVGTTPDFTLPSQNFTLCEPTETFPVNATNLVPGLDFGNYSAIALTNGTLSWGVKCNANCSECGFKTVLPAGQCKQVQVPGAAENAQPVFMIYNATVTNNPSVGTQNGAPTSTSTPSNTSAGSQARPASFFAYVVLAVTLMISALVF